MGLVTDRKAEPVEAVFTVRDPETGRIEVFRGGHRLGDLENYPPGSSEWITCDEWGGVSSETAATENGALRHLGVRDGETVLDAVAAGPRMNQCHSCESVQPDGTVMWSDGDDWLYCGHCAGAAVR